MHFELVALYAGPDQIMTVTSGVASVVGVGLMFWNKLVSGCTKLLRRVRNADSEGDAPQSDR
jgi:hypothetical protein